MERVLIKNVATGGNLEDSTVREKLSPRFAKVRYTHINPARPGTSGAGIRAERSFDRDASRAS